MTIPELLERAGHPLGSHGRTTCPIHRGDNKQEFSYTDTRWFCFACNEGGGPKKLAQALGFDKVPVPQLGNPLSVAAMLSEPGRPSVIRQLDEGVAELRLVRLRVTAERHRALLDWLEAALVAPTDDEQERGMQVLVAGYRALAHLHQVMTALGLPCDCLGGREAGMRDA